MFEPILIFGNHILKSRVRSPKLLLVHTQSFMAAATIISATLDLQSVCLALKLYFKGLSLKISRVLKGSTTQFIFHENSALLNNISIIVS